MDAMLLLGLGRVLAFESTHRAPAGLRHLDDRMLRDIGYEPGVGWIEEIEARTQIGRDEPSMQPAARLRPSHA